MPDFRRKNRCFRFQVPSANRRDYFSPELGKGDTESHGETGDWKGNRVIRKLVAVFMGLLLAVILG